MRAVKFPDMGGTLVKATATTEILAEDVPLINGEPPRVLFCQATQEAFLLNTFRVEKNVAVYQSVTWQPLDF